MNCVFKVLFATAFILTGTLWGESYASKVKSLYLSDNPKAVGRLLPTAEVKMLGEVDGKAQIEIIGWIEDGVPSAIYFVPNRRILVAGIDKKTTYEFETIRTIEDGGKKWLNVKARFLTDKNDFVADVESLYKSAESAFASSCAICHKLHQAKEFNANQWPSIINSMLSRTAISKDESYLLIQYLQKNAKDMPYEFK